MASNSAAAAGEQSYTNGHGYLGDTTGRGNLGDGNMNAPAPGTAPAAAAAAAAKPHQTMVSQVYEPQFYKIANPGPLGLISFALTTFVLGLYQCGAG